MKALLKRCEGSIKASLRRYSGSIKALSRRLIKAPLWCYYGAIVTLLRLVVKLVVKIVVKLAVQTFAQPPPGFARKFCHASSKASSKEASSKVVKLVVNTFAQPPSGFARQFCKCPRFRERIAVFFFACVLLAFF